MLKSGEFDLTLRNRKRMSDTRPEPRRRLPRASQIIPIAALLAGAIAAFWPRGKDPTALGGGVSDPEILTPAHIEAIEPGRGRCADAPWKIPPLGWKDILWRSWREAGRDRLPALAGSVTFYILLAVFPAAAAFVSLYGIFSDVSMVQEQLHQMSAVFPAEVLDLIGRQMLRIATQRPATLSAAFIAGIAVSVWSANAGMKALFDGLNIAYGETEKRDYLQRTLFSYAATFVALCFLAVVTAVLVAAPIFLQERGYTRLVLLWFVVRWGVVLALAALAFVLVYRYGPSRAPARWRWVTGGGVMAAILWMAGSMGFSFYVNNIAHFDATYGSLGAVIAFMVWVWTSVMVVLMGAELNAEIEHQTACDSTTGDPMPMGERGAVMADTIGRAFTATPREAVEYGAAFAARQVGYVTRFFGGLFGRKS